LIGSRNPVISLIQGGRLVGYARVSTDDQDLSLQIDALEKHGIAKSLIFMDKLPGATSQRPGLAKCLDALQSGDTLVVWRLDRLGRSMQHLITLVEELRSRGVGFRSLNEGAIDTTSASGELIFNIFSALAQFERRLIQERTNAGLAAARARGRYGGRPRVESEEAIVRAVKKLSGDPSISIDDICRTLVISRSTYYRYLSLNAVPDGGCVSAASHSVACDSHPDS
jgi:DNA invertase Pin-like site-specific DNA recombinase